MKTTKSVVWPLAILAASLVHGFSQSTNPPILGISKNGATARAVLSWNSKTNEIYSILYSTNLTSDWLSAATDFANQGTNTIWSDIGTESGLGSRSSSADYDAPIRFYRLSVQGYTSNSFPATITFSNVASGTVLSEFTNIFAGAVSSSNLISGKLSVDGNDVAFDSGGSYEFPLETRFYPNGTHTLSITVEDNGDSGTTGGDDPSGPAEGSDSSASYAAKNISVTFSNSLSDVWLKYEGYRPELGQSQEIHGTWSSPRNWQVNITSAGDTNTVYRAFGGSGTSIVVLWDGLDSNGNQLDPQRVAYVIYDLGASSQSSLSLLSASRSVATETAASPPPPPPLPWDTNYWSSGIQTTTDDVVPFNPSTATSDSATDKSLLGVSTATSTLKAAFGGFSPNGAGGSGSGSSPFITYSTYKTFGTFGMLYQGHHPWFSPSNRPQRGAPFGQVTFATGHNPPWGKLKAGKRIASDVAVRFPISGYPLGFIYGDDDFKAAALQKSSLGGSNILNNVTIGLYVGHSAMGKENIVALAHPQSYIPVYDSGAGTMTWVGMYDMDLGSSNLKWMAFYSCNLFRDDAYRANGSYSLMKNNEHLAMNSSLHIMQAYATEVTVRHDMGLFWTVALIGSTSLSSDNTVLGAWRYVCLKTQPVESVANANVSRSAYWEECASDHIYGYGSQTDPDPSHIQEELLEDDQMANTSP
jgi:hypothetical protein